ncbi:Ribosomal protein S18 acetylase RimI [Sphingomonas laterariae]|uniref:Ribosomal protein S18 acetylase RimI n=1 Tax=Edaphosphingomonas laterariae TaxID=861865 RepID=A0A239HNV3_9SPHN|nr:N-acetyltransferase [Sphingomonas laterariae]SNS82778.1 Ribosomal protein S18 acetylase RimI [Sphingomonas laterariae]
MDWQIRPAGQDDIGRLALVGAATFLESFAGILDGAAIVEHCARQHDAGVYARYLQAGASAWLAEAAEGGAPIGYALVTAPDLPGAEPGDLELKRIYTLSRCHGGGLGAALMRHAVDRAAAQGASRLLLGVYGQNARAIAFYRKQGFEQIGERRFRVGHRDYDDVVLARPLGVA